MTCTARAADRCRLQCIRCLSCRNSSRQCRAAIRMELPIQIVALYTSDLTSRFDFKRKGYCETRTPGYMSQMYIVPSGEAITIDAQLKRDTRRRLRATLASCNGLSQSRR